MVCHDIFWVLAMMPAVVVEPLLPPHPTSMRPVLGTLRAVRNFILVTDGMTVVPSTRTWLYSYDDSMWVSVYLHLSDLTVIG